MKLATLKHGGRDGTLVLLSQDLNNCVEVPDIAPTMQAAFDGWAALAPRLREVAERLDHGAAPGARPFDPRAAAAPLPRAYQFLDGSAFLNHARLARRARGAELPDQLLTDPLMYQALSDTLKGPHEPILVADDAWGIDFESEVAVITDDVPMGVTPAGAAGHILALVLLNDVSLRNLIPAELAKGFGFVQSKPATHFAAAAVTVDALAPYWDGTVLHRRVETALNGSRYGDPDAGVEMQFDFPTLVAHAARTRALSAGTIIGSGTISNSDRARGSSCIAERRGIEQIETGRMTSPFLAFGDRVRIEVCDDAGRSIFGAIDHFVARYAP